jgi:hypothetical protein
LINIIGMCWNFRNPEDLNFYIFFFFNCRTFATVNGFFNPVLGQFPLHNLSMSQQAVAQSNNFYENFLLNSNDKNNTIAHNTNINDNC